MSRELVCVDCERFSLLSSVQQCKHLQLVRRLLQLAVLLNRIVSAVTIIKPDLKQVGFVPCEPCEPCEPYSLPSDVVQSIVNDQVTYRHAVNSGFPVTPLIVMPRPLCWSIVLSRGAIVPRSVIVTVNFNRIRFDNHSKLHTVLVSLINRGKQHSTH